MKRTKRWCGPLLRKSGPFPDAKGVPVSQDEGIEFVAARLAPGFGTRLRRKPAHAPPNTLVETSPSVTNRENPE
jgi:hypothetical protein